MTHKSSTGTHPGHLPSAQTIVQMNAEIAMIRRTVNMGNRTASPPQRV